MVNALYSYNFCMDIDMAVFIDYVALSQCHEPGSLPFFGSALRLDLDPVTGVLHRKMVLGDSLEGSFSTSVHVRCDQSRVSVSGNPSAYGRPDNVFGFATVRQGVDVYNSMLNTIELPEFDYQFGDLIGNDEIRQANNDSKSLHYSLAPNINYKSIYPISIHNQKYVSLVIDNKHYAFSNQLIDNGRSKISRVDITENLFVSDVDNFLRHMSGYVHHGKTGFLYPNGKTVEWGGRGASDKHGSRRVYIKYYNKAWDIEQKILKLSKKLGSANRDQILCHIDYLTRLYHWCNQVGLVRLEVTFKSTELVDRNLTEIQNWNIDMNNIIYPYQFHKKIKTEQTRFDDISHELQQMGFSKRIADKAELVHSSWVAGKDVKKLSGSKTTYYRYRSILLNFGVDIFNPCDISRIPLRVNKMEWAEAVPPDWYIMPGQSLQSFPKLRLVA